MNVQQFLASFPEFQSTDTALVQAKLNEAALDIGRDAFGSFSNVEGNGPITFADKVQGYLAAHLLSQSPLGQATRLEPNKGETTYWKEYKRLLDEAAVPGGVVVAGGSRPFGSGRLGPPWR